MSRAPLDKPYRHIDHRFTWCKRTFDSVVVWRLMYGEFFGAAVGRKGRPGRMKWAGMEYQVGNTMADPNWRHVAARDLIHGRNYLRSLHDAQLRDARTYKG